MATEEQREAVAAKLQDAEAVLEGLLSGGVEIEGFRLGGPRGNVSECVYRAAKLLAEAREGVEA